MGKALANEMPNVQKPTDGRPWALPSLPLFRRHAQNDVEAGRQLAGLRPLDRGEVDGHAVPRLAARDAAVHPVLGVPLVALDVALGAEQLLLPLLDLEVDVRRPKRVR